LKILKKWIVPEVINSRISPRFDDDKKLVGFYLKKMRGTVSKKYFSDEAWNYLCNHFEIKGMKMKLKEQLKLQSDIEVPFEVWRFLGPQSKLILVRGDEASLGEDFGNKEQLQKAVEFYVDQLGGKVNWEK
jgi:hypothetical protein